MLHAGGRRGGRGDGGLTAAAVSPYFGSRFGAKVPRSSPLECRMRLPILIALALGSAGLASAQSPAADAPVATANGTSSSPSTQAQIDDYLASSPILESPRRDLGDLDDQGLEDDRRIHGQVSLSVGTGGYRSGAVSAVIPLPRDGTLALEYSHTESDRGYGYGYGPGYGAEADSREDLSPFGGCPSVAWTGAASVQPRWIGRDGAGSAPCPLR